MKALQEMNLIDSFIFSCSTENIKDAEFIAKLIIKRVIGHTIDKVVIETEKQLKGINVDKRGIRMDLCVSQMENGNIARIYDIEPNVYKQTEVFLRSRFYQSLSDSKLLDISEDFGKLAKYISIWILSYDPFGENRMIYHVKNMVEENPALCYNDGTAKIYLYTGGEIGGTEELKSLLKFFEESTDENATDKELKELLGIVDRVKGSEKVGEQYMVFKSGWDYELEEEVEKRVEETVEKRVEEEVEKQIKKDIADKISSIISALRRLKATDEQVIVALVAECSITEDEARKILADN